MLYYKVGELFRTHEDLMPTKDNIKLFETKRLIELDAFINDWEVTEILEFKAFEEVECNIRENSSVYLLDNMKLMKTYPDDYFDVAIVDPPYGINFSTYKRGRKGTKTNARYVKDGEKDWDASIPTDDYFDELFRVSKNQIIWGGNYFDLPPCKCFVFWYKQNPAPTFSDGEYAWTSFDKPAKCFDFRYYGNLSGKTSIGDKIHPTEKPVQLYDWLYINFVENGMKVLDTHLGGGSHRIAAWRKKIDFVGCELERDFFEKSNKRFELFISQSTLF